MTRGHVDDRNYFLLQERYCKSLCFRGHFIYLPCRDNLIRTTEGAEKWFKKIQRNENTIRLDNHCKVAGITSAFLLTSLPAAPLQPASRPLTLSGGCLLPTDTTSACTAWSSLVDWYLWLPFEGGWYCGTGPISPFWRSLRCGFAGYLRINRSRKAGQVKAEKSVLTRAKYRQWSCKDIRDTCTWTKPRNLEDF